MTENVKVSKIWIYIFYIWLGLGSFALYYYKTQDLTEIIEKAGPVFIPYLIAVYLILCCVFIKKSKIFEFLKGRIANIFTGIISIIVALEELHSGEISYHWGFPVSKGAFVILLLIGICLLLFGTFRKVKDESLYYFICVDCKKTFDKELNVNSTCPECNGNVINYKSFFEQGYEYTND